MVADDPESFADLDGHFERRYDWSLLWADHYSFVLRESNAEQNKQQNPAPQCIPSTADNNVDSNVWLQSARKGRYQCGTNKCNEFVADVVELGCGKLKAGAMMRRSMLTFVIIIVAIVMFFGGWALTYPGSNDPKNVRYALWKANLYKVSLDQATAAMVGDPKRDRLVVGKTKAQLRDKFGSLLSLSDASPYLIGCYQNSSWRERDVLFIGQSSWMVVFDGEKATNLVLIKGC